MSAASDMHTHVIRWNDGDTEVDIQGLVQIRGTRVVASNSLAIVLKQPGSRYGSLVERLYAPAQFRVYTVVREEDGGELWDHAVRGRELISFPVRA